MLSRNTNDTLNILLLGEEGVGKSTLINSAANYFTYKTLTEAQESPLVTLISSKHTVTESNGNVKIIETIAKDDRLFHKTLSWSYNIVAEDKKICFINTPCIGDIEKESNILSKMSFLSKFDEIHGICIVLKSTENLPKFKNAINEIFTRFHKFASKNIVFCFTNTFYKPIRTFDLLKQCIEEIKTTGNLDISLSRKNIFCFDNKAYQYLCGLQNGIKYSKEEKEDHKRSWNKAAVEMQRMFNHFDNILPHFTKDTLAYCEARSVALLLMHVQCGLDEQIQKEEIEYKTLQKEFCMIKSEMEALRKKQVQIEFKIEKKQYPSLVCTSAECSPSKKIKRTAGYFIPEYKKCHEYCWCNTSGDQEKVPNPGLQNCKIMDKNLKCINCGCSWDVHMKTQHQQILKTTDDEAVQKQFHQKFKEYLDHTKLLTKTQFANVKTENEKENVYELCSKFFGLAKIHGILFFNNEYESYYKNVFENVEKSEHLQVSFAEHQKIKPIINLHLEQEVNIMNSEKSDIENILDFVLPLEKYSVNHNNKLLSYLITKKANSSKDIIAKRMSMFNQRQKDHQTEEEFLKDIFELTKQCQFEEMESFAVLIFIRGLKNAALKTYLLSLEELPQTFSEIQAIVKAFMKKEKKKSASHDGPRKDTWINQTPKLESKKLKKCRHCGSEKYHPYYKCYAKKEICANCNEIGHIAKACEKKK